MADISDTLQPGLSSSWRSTAARLKTAFNSLLYDPSRHLYRDNPSSTLYPQDGNALALLYGLTTTPPHAQAISDALQSNWNDIGPVTPELPDTISPFISSLEVMAHFTAGRPQTAMRLIRRLWGFMVDASHLGGGTLVEGLAADGSLK